MMRTLVIAAWLLVTLGTAGAGPAAAQQTASGEVKLVVVLVVDQMRSSYIDSYGRHFTGGFKRLTAEGAWFRQAAYPYLNTVTCAGHATIGTGTLPYRHGMVLNAWWNRETNRSNACTTDPDVRNLAYSGAATGGDSARALLAPTLAQQIKGRGGRSIAISLKPRSAITMGGRNATAVVWFDDRAGWATSTAFAPEPLDWLQAFFTAHPISADRGRSWERLLPPEAYTGEDSGKGERAPNGWTTAFPHVVATAPELLHLQWQRSPFADDYLGRLAAHAIDSQELGRGKGIDFLSVSFSTLDLVGHLFGPDSHEVQDVLFRLDRTVGALLDHLDAKVGKGKYVLALSADHGVAPLPETTGASRQPSSEVVAAINGALVPFLGPGNYVAGTAYTDVYLVPNVARRLRNTPNAAKAVADALRATPGIAHVYYAHELGDRAARNSNDPIRRAAALSYHPDRSGDLIIVPRENWLLSTAATTHGTLYGYDRQVPVIFFGAGVPAGQRQEPATPADIAPTLAALAGVRIASTDGQALIK